MNNVTEEIWKGNNRVFKTYVKGNPNGDGKHPIEKVKGRDHIHDFDEVEQGLSLEEALMEASRCLRCDHYGFGSFRGGRNTKW